MKLTTIRLHSEDDVAKVVSIFDSYGFDIDIGKGRHLIDGKSLLGIMAFGLECDLDVYTHTNNISVMEDLCQKLQDWRVTC